METTNILVPVNFSEESRKAIQNALELADSMNCEVSLLHIVESENDIEQARKRLEEEKVTAINQGKDISIHAYVRVGNVLDDIDKFAKEYNSSFIVMGHTGEPGEVNSSATYILRIITDADSPVIVVQDKSPNKDGYKKILVPLDLNNETKQKLEVVREIANYFNSEVVLISPEETDEYFKEKINANIIWAKKYLAEEGVKSDFIIVGHRHFTQEIIEKAGELNVDLIAIMNLQKVSFFGLLNSGFELDMISNKFDIPVLCVNPKIATTGWSPIFFAYPTN